MNKTKVRVSPNLCDYWQVMTQRVNDLRDSGRFDAGRGGNPRAELQKLSS